MRKDIMRSSDLRKKRIRKKRKKRFLITLSVLVVIAGGILFAQYIINKENKKNSQNVNVQASKEDEKKSDPKENENKKDSKEENKEDKPLLKNKNVNPEGDKYAIEAEKVKSMIEGKGEKDDKKIAFLTFDDGPSTTVTPKILDTLKEKDVKATFFLVGNAVDNKKHEDLVKRAFNEGHALANHSYTHNYKTLYPGNHINIDAYMDEFNKTNEAIKKILGDDFNTRVMRMPGGYMSRKHYKDPNLNAFDQKLSEKNIVSIDWNALNGDAEGKKRGAGELLERAKKTVKGHDKAIILMHDTYGKEGTAEALPQIIDFLKGEGYEFRSIK
ncbi:polysaccharide deacetylase family protein [Clostridium hydrogeniformans]|uniref:polysaccharide deacetylase family protein n=1 Tax=Clostridium hydrogeniformans TaxID=349933 RepID=UPI00068B0FBA|nr:polysaccharide deacetylase family protein [Clostridium hydrogeniformans]